MLLLFLVYQIVLANSNERAANCTSALLLHVRDCPTLTLDPGISAPLTFVDLSNNPGLQVEEDTPESWTPSSELLRLKVEACALRVLPQRLLAHAILLEWFSVRGNALTRLPYAPFTGNSHLIHLSLAANRLRYLGDSSFQGLVDLKYLDVSDNRISVIDRWAFLPLISLRTLLLNGNRLVTFSGELIEQLPVISRLVLYPGNYFVCDCRLRRLRYWKLLTPPPRAHSIHGNDNNNNNNNNNNDTGVVCSAPAHIRGHQLMTLQPEALVCDSTSGIYDRERYANGVGERKYDVMVGIYTAMTLAGMLVSFLVCLLLDRLKRAYIHRRRAKRSTFSVNQPKIAELPSPKRLHGKSLWSGQSSGVIADFGYIQDNRTEET